MKDELKNNHIDYLDAAFLGTMESQGFKNAKSAVKLCLFNDMSVLDNKDIDYSKWLLISSQYDGRRKAKKLQVDDLAHILIKYAMASFGLKRKNFTVTEAMYLEHRQIPLKSADLSREEAVELVAFAAYNDVYSAYVFIFSNSYVCNLVVDSLISERYMDMLIDDLDKFNGKIDNDDLSTEFRYMYYQKYNKLDSEFAELKLENDNYIKDL